MERRTKPKLGNESPVSPSRESSLLDQALAISSRSSTERVEDLLRTLTDEAIRGTVSYRDNLANTLEQAIQRLSDEQKKNPDAQDALQVTIDKLSELRSRANDSERLSGLLEAILENQFDLSALAEQLPKGGQPPVHTNWNSDTPETQRSFSAESQSKIELSPHYSSLGKFLDGIVRSKHYSFAEKSEDDIVKRSDLLNSTTLNGLRISKTEQVDDQELESRLQELERYAKEHSGEGVAAYAKLLLPELGAGRPAQQQPSALALPNKAPEIYQGLRGPETPPQFVQRVYGEWLGHGLTRANIRQLDPVLYTAINNWLKKPENTWPSDVDLPTLKEQNDRELEGVLQGTPQNMTLKDARRLEGALRRRSNDGPTKN